MAISKGHIRAGVTAVRSAKLRSFWTMLGVIIGVTSVITVVAIGQGIKQQIGGQIHKLGNDLITIRPAQLHGSTGVKNNGVNVLSGLNVTGALTKKDIMSVAQTPGVSASAPLTITTGAVKSDVETYDKGFVIGTSASLASLLNQNIEYGSFLTEDDMGTDAAVLGAGAAEDLFDENVPLGRSFTFHGHEFVVRGIFNRFNTTPLSEQADFNKAIFIPNDVAQSLSNNTAPTYEILARPKDKKQTAKIAAVIQGTLSKNHGGQDNFEVLQGNQNLQSSDGILDLLTRLIAGVAAISLLVGGIGIMNVMLVSVAERTHEIGIRKAIGATDRQILSQFMIEATVLSLTGGIIGIILSLIIDLVLRLTTNLQPVISWQVALLATGVSLLVGVIFGTVPALKAARKDPIDALRSQ
ncbi:MAG: ABC transporter permease [Patescibacteria group bacterium]|nr:ABC transporter permease [Patescibacteria group bacterium]